MEFAFQFVIFVDEPVRIQSGLVDVALDLGPFQIILEAAQVFRFVLEHIHPAQPHQIHFVRVHPHTAVHPGNIAGFFYLGRNGVAGGPVGIGEGESFRRIIDAPHMLHELVSS